MKRLSFLLLFVLISISVAAYVEIDGICYSLDTYPNIASVVPKSSKYSGDVVIPESIEYDGKEFRVTSIGEEAFEGCSNLTSITFPNSLTAIRSFAFRGCSSLTSITFPNNLTDIGFWAFEGCSSLKLLDVSESVTYFDETALYGCDNLEKIIIHNIAAWCKTKFCHYGDYCFMPPHHLFLNDEEIINLVIPDSVKLINCFAFWNCPYLKSIVISDSVEEVGFGAFKGCSRVTSLKIGSNVKRIGSLAFSDCTSLEYVYINDSENPLSVGYNDNSGRIYDLESHPNYPNGLFGDSKLKKVYLGRNLDYIGSAQFSAVVAFSSRNYEHYSPFKNQYQLEEVTIGDKVTIIPSHLFYKCESIHDIRIPQNVEKIGDFSFFYCTNLKKLVIEDSVLPLYMGWNRIENREASGLFETCSLESLYLGRNLTLEYSHYSISPFYNCAYLNNVSISNNVSFIGKRLFEGCSSLRDLELPNSVTLIDDLAFRESGLTSFTVPNSVTSIGDFVFSCCDSLKSISLGNSILTIGKGQFDSCENLISVTSLNPTPPIYNSGSFYYTTYEKGVLYVPIGSKASYASAPEWKYFDNIIEIDVTTVNQIKAKPSSLLGKGNVYTLKGELINPSEALILPKGIYIFNGKKVLVK